jgi:PAS domain S-box-containing protein
MKNINSYSGGIKQHNRVEELLAIFDNFNSNAQKLEASYKQFQDRVKKIDQEMAYTNECLNKKVQELNNLTGYLNNILQSMHSGVVAIDIKGEVITFNKAAEIILDVKAKNVIGKDIKSILNHISGFTDLLIESLSKRNNILNLERIIGAENGSTRYIESSISILKDGNENITGVVEIFHDLSEIYELKGRLHSASNLISVGTMAASVAHEIRNPLNGIEGFAYLLERKLKGDSLKLVKNVIRGAKNINKIVTDLLLLARPIKLNLRKYKLTNVIDKSLVFVSHELSQNGNQNIQIKKDYTCLNDIIECDPERLQQAFLNIMLNAIQSMHEGGQITVFTRESTLNSRPGIQVGFVDTGNGISNDAVKKIFEPFFTTKNDGTGLGLAIVRNIIGLHGGQVTINSEHKKGTTFLVNLPNNHYVKLKSLKDENLLNSIMA